MFRRISDGVKHLLIINVIMFGATFLINPDLMYSIFGLYFPENNIISIQVLTTRFMSEGMLVDDLDFNILEHTTNNLVVKQDGITSTSSFNWKFKTSLTKVQ